MSIVVASILVIVVNHLLGGHIVLHKLVESANHPVVVENAFMDALEAENVPIVVCLIS